MKTFISCMLVSGFLSSSVFAFDYCKEREIFEAKIKHAKLFNIDFAEVNLGEYKPGPWTRMEGNNHGKDSVVVFHWSPDGEEKVSKEYRVHAKQIETTSDCEIITLTLQE